MSSSLFLSMGVLRSGSTWAYNVCQQFGRLLAARRRQPFGTAYMIHSELEMFLNTEGVNLRGPTVIKAHTIGQTALNWITTGKAKVVCTYRDPRDCVVSMMTFFGSDLAATSQQIAESFDYLKFYQQAGNTLFIRYEEMMANPLGQIEQIGRHLQVDVDRETLRKIEHATNLQNSKLICEDLKQRPEEKVLRSGTHRVDPVTGLHDNHIFNAKIGRWKDELSDAQAESLTKFFHPWLVALGYAPNAGGTLNKAMQELPAPIEAGIQAGPNASDQSRN
jgi:Sulfotransferase domain